MSSILPSSTSNKNKKNSKRRATATAATASTATPTTGCQQFVITATGRSFKRLRLDNNNNQQQRRRQNFDDEIDEGDSDEILDSNYLGGDEGDHRGKTGGDFNIDEDDNTEENKSSILSPSLSANQSCSSSWVASLQSMGSNNNGMFRRCRQLRARAHQVINSSHNNDIDDDDADDDSDGCCNNNNDDNSCAAMTTAAVAPRKRRPMKQRRTIGFTVQATAGNNAPTTKLSQLKNHGENHSSDNYDVEDVDEDDLQVEELEMKPSPRGTDKVRNENIPNNDDDDVDDRVPVEFLPDPLLVAAQHAMVLGGEEEVMAPHYPPHPHNGVDYYHRHYHHQYKQNSSTMLQSNKNNYNNNMESLLLMGDCCSSVTEEETSLAEDEASLSAISIGAITTMSALSGPGDGNTVVMGGAPPTASASASVETFKFKSNDNAAKQQQQRQKRQNAAVAATTQLSSSDCYTPLNNMLGGLHKERITRQQHHLSIHNQHSSFHSLGSGSEECHNHDGGGGSFLSLPTNPGSTSYQYEQQQNQQQSIGMMMTTPQTPPPPPPAAFFLMRSRRDEDEDEEMEDVAVAASSSSFIGNNRMKQHHRNHAGSSGNLNFTSSIADSKGKGGDGVMDTTSATYSREDGIFNGGDVPKWKRRVNLPSHSSLY